MIVLFYSCNILCSIFSDNDQENENVSDEVIHKFAGLMVNITRFWSRSMFAAALGEERTQSQRDAILACLYDRFHSCLIKHKATRTYYFNVNIRIAKLEN